MLYRETLLVAPTVRFTAFAVMTWPICYSDTFFFFDVYVETSSRTKIRLLSAKLLRLLQRYSYWLPMEVLHAVFLLKRVNRNFL